MTQSRNFWIAQIAGLGLLYAVGLVLYFSGQPAHFIVRLCAIIVVAHVLEVPLAFYLLRGRNAQPLRVLLATLCVGLLWWVPARRGIFALR